MVKLFKKKKEKKGSPDATEGAAEEIATEGEESAPAPKKKKKGLVKKFLIIVIVLGVLGGGGFAAYTFFFSGAGDESGRAPYKPQTLSHVQLPEEMRRFCYERLPELYDAILEYNAQMTLLNEKIAQIEAVAQKYPGEAKIADKEKKVWEKTRDTLEKSFNKLEKPVKESYVLFRVNQEAGLATVEEKKQDLTKTAADALALAKEMTDKLIETEKAPEGLIKGTIYKLKKKFL